MTQPIYPVNIDVIGDAGNLIVRFNDGEDDARDVLVTHPDVLDGLNGLLRLIDSLDRSAWSDAI